MACVVFLHAHPDDEAIFTGGTMARLSAAGHRVIVVVATSGELGRPRTDDPGSQLPRHREHETRAACATLGIERVEFLGYHDSGMPGDPANHAPGSFFASDTALAARQLVETVDDEHIDAIVVYDAGGIYGHPDHIQVHRVGVVAARMAGVATLYQATIDREYLHFVETHVVDQAHRAVPGHLAANIGVPSVMVTTTVDVRSTLDVKREAIAAHASQVPESSTVMTMPRASFARVYGYEWYIREGPAGPIEEISR